MAVWSNRSWLIENPGASVGAGMQVTSALTRMCCPCPRTWSGNQKLSLLRSPNLREELEQLRLGLLQLGPVEREEVVDAEE